MLFANCGIDFLFSQAILKLDPGATDAESSVTAPVGHRVRCALVGHDWRRAIAPREGFYLRCRRCWISREEADAAAGRDADRWSGTTASHTHA